ncbi:MAG: polysaccharide export protein [Myxococcaceae bacterium]|jgi:polysaccharide export outer membrane protein|nr:polysaccharide export protein [Myxococcaceae bacterium]
MRRLAALTLPLALALVAACKTPRPLGGQLRPDELGVPDGGVSSNTLGTGDFLEVRVYQEPDLSGIFRVSPEGVIDFPLCGKVRVSSLTPSLAADAITGCLKQGYVRRPQVTVMVKEFNSKRIFVFGDVSKPGSFPYEEGMTIVSAVSAAGGFNRTAARNGVNITRLIEGRETRVPVKVDDIINGSQKNFALLPGDIVFVPEAIF